MSRCTIAGRPSANDPAARIGPGSAWARGVLDHLHHEFDREPAPPGAPYKELLRYRRMIRL